MSAYVPLGSQAPFEPGRGYGQEPGFVSRHAGKIAILITLFVIVGTIFVWATFISSEDDTDDPNGATLQTGVEQPVA
ncbi:MAG: hypothetical protein WD208_08530 [Dehalococcoidia bacterium]